MRLHADRMEHVIVLSQSRNCVESVDRITYDDCDTAWIILTAPTVTRAFFYVAA